jgi:hypothetical protein
LEQANAFLNSYIKQYNAQFALDDDIPSVFEKQPDIEQPPLVFMTAPSVHILR